MATGPENTVESTTQNGDPRFQTDNSVSKKTQPKQQLSKAMEHMRFAVTADPIPHASTPTPPTDSLDPTVQNLSSQPSATQPENDAYGVPASFAPVRNPASRSHDPTNNQKRSDPFAFGSRYLEEGDNIFEFNAWDHVSVDSTYLAFSEEQYAKQRQDPVSDFDRARFNAQPEKWWNTFYKNNKANFFKNRKWLAQEFPVLHDVGKEDAGEAVVLEVGAGAGNSAFPILQNSQNEKLRIHACDFSKKAVELIRANELYDESKIRADVWDVAASPDSENNGLPPGLSEGSVDVVLMIFIFSALNPTQWDQAVRNIWRVLKPGGQVLFRDYGRGDLAQVRFKKGRWMEENFYVRGDGTRVYFFEKDELEEIWGGKKREGPDGTGEKDNKKERSNELVDALVQETGDTNLLESATQHKDTKERSSELVDALVQQTGDTSLTDSASQHKDQKQNPTSNLVDALVQETGNTSLIDSAVQHREAKSTSQEQGPRPIFEVAHIGVDRRMLVNRQRRLKMYRCWMQAVFRKPGDESKVATSTLRQEKQDENVEEEDEA